jgi:hypothetical protein
VVAALGRDLAAVELDGLAQRRARALAQSGILGAQRRRGQDRDRDQERPDYVISGIT